MLFSSCSKSVVMPIQPTRLGLHSEICQHASTTDSARAGFEIGLESLRTDRIFLFFRASMVMIVGIPSYGAGMPGSRDPSPK